VEGELRFHPLLREFLRRRLQADDAGAFARRAALIVEDAAAEGRWEEAFELSVETGNLNEAARIAGLGARPLLAAGQSERLEKWLSVCGAAGVTVASAALARAELLVREGEISAASALAQDTARRLSEEHPDHAWASNVAGRALHFASREEEAFERFEAGRRTAKTAEDEKDALWGLVLTSAEIAPETMTSYLDDLENRFADDVDVRFRLAVGQALALEMRCSLVGAWDRYAALMTSIEHSRDPLAASTFLASGSSVALLRGNYSVARELAARALRYCTDLRLAFAVGPCYAYLAAAETGLRRFGAARRAWQSFSQSGVQREDPYFRVEGLAIRARLLASQGAFQEALATRSETSGALPSRPLGAYLATIAMIEAAAGDPAVALATVAQARSEANSLEREVGSMLAEAVVAGIEGHDKDFRAFATEAVLACARTEYLDGLVLAYRVFPRLLDVGREDGETLSTLAKALVQSHDFKLAREAGIEIGPYGLEDSLSALTTREREVLGLLSQGMTNSEIAERLFITPSTAKVHVRHILEKLGVRNRLQAVLRAQDLLNE
ncbi:MAG: LuxR C-terminal-related transcriptional regulator, partial [Gemmatimonadaceae bacterium]